MSEPITFFRKRQQDAGYTYAFDLQSSTRVYGSTLRVYRVFVYSREPVEEEAVQPHKLLDYDQELEKLRQAIRSDAVIVWTYEEGAKRSFQVVPVGAEGSSLKSYGVLRPGSALSLEEVNFKKWLQVSAGTHLLVPVSRDAEGHLKNLKESLDSLPPDLESLILYAIRKPSLDSRLRDLEARKSAMAGWMGPIREWAVPILLVLILALNVALLLRTSPKADNSAAVKDQTSTGGVDTNGKDHHEGIDKGSKPSTEEPAKQDQAERNQKIFKVVQAVQNKAGAVPVFAALRDGNFKGLTNERDIAAALKEARRAKPLVLGLMKLEALRLDTAKAVKDLFKIAENPNSTKAAFQGQTALDNDTNARDLLAVLGCLGYGVPGLPKGTFKNGAESPELMLVQGQSCKSFSHNQATQGLDDLLISVEQYSPEGGEPSGAD
jgi:hypothetical protein